MSPYVVLFVLAGCVAIAAVLLLVTLFAYSERPGKLRTFSRPVELDRVLRSLTPQSFPVPAVEGFADTTLHVSAPRDTPTERVMPLWAAATVLPPHRRFAPPRRPTLREGRRRKLVRVLITSVFVTSIVSCLAFTAYPAMLDPLCDDYEWFGAGATQALRQAAYAAHEPINLRR